MEEVNVTEEIIEEVIEEMSEEDKIVQMNIIIDNEIQSLKQLLSESDYKVIKIIEYTLAGKVKPYDVVALHKERQSLRDKISELEASIVEL